MTWRFSLENATRGGKLLPALPDTGKDADPGKTIARDVPKSGKDTVALLNNQKPSSAGTGPFVDQSNLEQPGIKPGWLAMSWTISQTFKPRMPVLTGADIDLVNANPVLGASSITVEIRNNKTNQVLARESRVARVGFTGLLHFDFTNDVPITVGDTYVLYVPGPGDNFGWKYAHNTYPDGFRTFTGRQGSNPRPNQDCLFQTYGKPMP